MRKTHYHRFENLKQLGLLWVVTILACLLASKLYSQQTGPGGGTSNPIFQPAVNISNANASGSAAVNFQSSPNQPGVINWMQNGTVQAQIAYATEQLTFAVPLGETINNPFTILADGSFFTAGSSFGVDRFGNLSCQNMSAQNMVGSGGAEFDGNGNVFTSLGGIVGGTLFLTTNGIGSSSSLHNTGYNKGNNGCTNNQSVNEVFMVTCTAATVTLFNSGGQPWATNTAVTGQLTLILQPGGIWINTGTVTINGETAF